MLLESSFLVKNLEDAPAPETLEPCITLTTKNDIIVTLTFPYWKLLVFLIPVLITYTSESVLQIMLKFAIFMPIRW